MINRDFLKNLPNLTKQEAAAIKSFEKDETRASFVGISDILRIRGYLEESIVMLEDGLRRFPKYSSARAQLAADYLARGMPLEALRETKRVIGDAPDNTQAQRLALKLFIYFDMQTEARNTLSILSQLITDDLFTSTVRKCISNQDWIGAKKWVISHFERTGITIPEQHAEAMRAPVLQASDEQSTGNGSWQVPPIVTVRQPVHQREETQAPIKGEIANPAIQGASSRHEELALPTAITLGSSLAHIRGDADRYLALRSVRPQNLRGYFFAQIQESNGDHDLDAATIENLYRSQGLRQPPATAWNDSTEIGGEELARQSFSSFAENSLFTAPPHSAESELKSKKIEKLKALLGSLDGV